MQLMDSLNRLGNENPQLMRKRLQRIWWPSSRMSIPPDFPSWKKLWWSTTIIQIWMFLKEKLSSMAAMSLHIGMRIVHHSWCFRVVFNAVCSAHHMYQSKSRRLFAYQPKLVHEIVNRQPCSKYKNMTRSDNFPPISRKNETGHPRWPLFVIASSSGSIIIFGIVGSRWWWCWWCEGCG